MSQWLVRTAQNWIAGPYSKDQVCQMILSGQISLQDEVCLENSYWIYVHERGEIQEQLGIQPPLEPSTEGDETTETHVASPVEDGPTDPHFKAESKAVELNSLPEMESEHTTVLNTKALKLQPHQPARVMPVVDARGQEESPLDLRQWGPVILAIVGMILGVLFIFHLKKR